MYLPISDIRLKFFFQWYYIFFENGSVMTMMNKNNKKVTRRVRNKKLLISAMNEGKEAGLNKIFIDMEWSYLS